MAENRRKQFYIDKIFQRKFLFLFLFLTFLVSAGNALYLLLFLKKDVENNLYRSRIVISNVNEIIANHVLVFNVALLIVITLLAVLFYGLIRKRVKYFLDSLDRALGARQGIGPFNNNDFDIKLPKEFEDMNDVLAAFWGVVDTRLEAERAALASLKKFAESPDEKTKQKLIERLVKARAL